MELPLLSPARRTFVAPELVPATVYVAVLSRARQHQDDDGLRSPSGDAVHKIGQLFRAEVVKLADTPSALQPLRTKSKSLIQHNCPFRFNDLRPSPRYRQQPPVDAMCRQSVQDPVQLGPWRSTPLTLTELENKAFGAAAGQ
jgi:hypothetical protein